MADPHPLKLNLGAGCTALDGYEAVDIKQGQAAYPLARADNCADEIRASHLLEHFPHGTTPRVLQDWVRVLRPGGVMKIGVPDFDYIVKQYQGGTSEWLEGYLMGGQTDDHDAHHAIFNRSKLTTLMEAAGLVDVTEWEPAEKDCSALPVSLNLQGTKPLTPSPAKIALPGLVDLPMRVGAAMSVPRLGFMDNFYCAIQALGPLRISLAKHTGVMWGQCIEKCIREVVDQGKDAVLTIDYDSLFTVHDVVALVRLMHAHPEADAICALQQSRSKTAPLMTIRAGDGVNYEAVTAATFAPDLAKIETGHFGLTLLRASAFADLPRPWFHSRPDADGGWDGAHLDDDIFFWEQWRAAGHSLYLANRIPIGHAELMVCWPDKELRTIWQHPRDFFQQGKPDGCWA